MWTAPNAASWARRACLTPVRALFLACGVTLGWLSADVAYGALVDPHRLRLLTTYMLPLFAAAILLSLWKLARAGPGPVRLAVFLPGAVFLVLAAGLDLFVTARSDPYLTLEANPYIRVLLDDTPHTYTFIYTLVGATQLLFVTAFVAAWWAFLRHLPRIAGPLRDGTLRTWPAFLKAATGGRHLTYRQWLLPLRPGEIPNPYYSVWPAALAVSFGTSLFRCWAAAEWLWLVPAAMPLRVAVLLLGVVGTLAAYFGWLAWTWRRTLADADVSARAFGPPLAGEKSQG